MTRPSWLSWAWLTALRGLSLLALASLVPDRALAQAGSSATDRLDISQPQRATLDSGLRIVAQRLPNTAVASVCITYQAGSRNEQPSQRGLARLVENLMTQGSRNLGPDDAVRLVTERGGMLDSETSSDFSQFCSELPNADLPLALWVEADRMRNLSATQAAFETQRDLLLMQQNTRSSSELHSSGLQRLTQLTYQDYGPYQNGVLGVSNDLQTLTLQDARDFHWRYYTPSNALLSIVADLEPSRAIELATRYFAAASNRASSPTTAPANVKLRQSTERLSVQSDDNCLTPGVYYGYPVPHVGSEDHRTVQVIATILGGSDTARIPYRLVTERASATRARVWLWGNQQADLLAIYATVAPLSSVDKVQEVVEAELKRLRFFGPNSQELESAKVALRHEWIRQAESALLLAKRMGRREALGVVLDVQRELDALQAITVDQIRRVAQLYFAENKRSIVEIYPPGWPQDEAPLVVVLKHTVKRGENLEGIARRYGSSVAEIVRVSGIDAKRAIQPGQVLKVPVVGGKVPAAPPAMRSHKVRSGDSLSLIAKIYGTTVAEIVRLNNLDRNKPIIVGQKLVIPPKQTSDATSPSKTTAPATSKPTPKQTAPTGKPKSSAPSTTPAQPKAKPKTAPAPAPKKK